MSLRLYYLLYSFSFSFNSHQVTPLRVVSVPKAGNWDYLLTDISSRGKIVGGQIA